MHFKSLLISIFVLHPLINHVHSQESNSNSLSLGFGGSNFHLLDKHASALIFRGTGIAPSIGYSHITSRADHSVYGEFYHDNLKSASENFQTEILGGHFRYAYLRKICSDKPIVSAGLSFSSFCIKSDYKFELPGVWAHSIETWYWSHSVDMAFRLKTECSGNQAGIEVFIPVISNVSRPEYSSSGDYDYEKNDWVMKPSGKTVFLFKNPAINARLTYSRNLTGNILLNAGYEFIFVNYKSPELTRFYMHNVRFGLSYNF